MASVPCRAIEGGWTLGSLVGTYLDLALAYLCLCAAAVAFLAAKFLALFGVSLPCSCGGQGARGHLHRPCSVCLQSLLLHYPTAKIAGVHRSLRRRFSFDSLCLDCRRLLSARCCCCRSSSSSSGLYDVKLANDEDNREDEGGCGSGGGGRTRPLLEVGDGAESCGSVSKPSRVSGGMLRLSGIVNDEEASELETSFRQGGNPMDVKGKGVLDIRLQSALRHRRRGRNSLITRTKSPPVSVSTRQLVWQGEGPILDINGQSQQVVWEGRSAPSAVTRTGHPISGDHDELVGRAASGFEYNSEDKNSLCEEKIAFGSERNELGMITDLKKALEEEKSARAALLLELEKERSWAATAADEAVAMILRLQEEKATIEMEARQYKRMTEEKSAYDEEEMDILKEIIVRRERETHVLEKEIESYREILLSDNGVSESNAKHEVHEITEENLFQSSDEAELMLKEIYRSIKKKEKAEDKMQYLDDCTPSATKENNLTSSSSRLLSFDNSIEISYLNRDSVVLSPSFEKKHQMAPNPGEQCNDEEKDMLTFEDRESSLQSQSLAKEFHLYRDSPGANNLHEPTSHLDNEEKGAQVIEIKIRDPLEDFCTKHDPNAATINSEASHRDNELSVVDVHVIDDITKLSGQGKENDIYLSPVRCASNMVDRNTMKNISMHRSCSDSIMGLSASRSYPRSSWSDLRRSSMSSVDSERFKLETEVEILRKRLKIIQEGREKLSNSQEQRKKEMHHLHVLEEISCQLQEIRKATETGKSIRRASLPPSSSKVALNRRRSRSVSTEQQEST